MCNFRKDVSNAGACIICESPEEWKVRDMMGTEAKGQWNCICNIWLDCYDSFLHLDDDDDGKLGKGKTI